MLSLPNHQLGYQDLVTELLQRLKWASRVFLEVLSRRTPRQISSVINLVILPHNNREQAQLSVDPKREPLWRKENFLTRIPSGSRNFFPLRLPFWSALPPNKTITHCGYPTVQFVSIICETGYGPRPPVYASNRPSLLKFPNHSNGC